MATGTASYQHHHMNKFALTLLATVTAASVSFAGTEYTPASSKSFKQPMIDTPAPCIPDSEFTLDVFGGYAFSDNDDAGEAYGDDFVIGAGLNYFFAKYYGLGAEYYIIGDTPLHSVNGVFTLRFPMDCWAPYVFGAAGLLTNGVSQFQGGAGAGLEYRIGQVGIFGDGRYMWTEEDTNYGVVRGGLRFSF